MSSTFVQVCGWISLVLLLVSFLMNLWIAAKAAHKEHGFWFFFKMGLHGVFSCMLLVPVGRAMGWW